MALQLFSEHLLAGFPSPAEGYEDEPLSIDAYLIRDRSATFLFRVTGDALATHHVRDGAIAVVQMGKRAKRGALVLAREADRYVVCEFEPECRAREVVGKIIGVVMRF